jgi:hypothetical protein
MKMQKVMKESLRKRIKQLKKAKSASNQGEILTLQMRLATLMPKKGIKVETPKEGVSTGGDTPQEDGEGASP